MHLERGYEPVFTPHLGKSTLWEVSGHLGFYKENMFPALEMDEAEYIAKPMNCPFHVLIYRSRTRSYRELPLRLSELGTVYRYERSGTLHGLLRARGFTQDDSHLFCRPDQVVDEMVSVIDFLTDLYATVGLKPENVRFSTKPPKAVGRQELWDMAESAIPKALERAQLEYEVDEGDGAFYGPKIDIDVRDAIGRYWQLCTIQVDFNLPERFGLEYVDEHGERVRPVMIHRALYGSIERFIGVLVEHFAGAFPTWLAPVQAALIPIADRHNDYAAGVAARLKKRGVRTEVDVTRRHDRSQDQTPPDAKGALHARRRRRRSRVGHRGRSPPLRQGDSRCAGRRVRREISRRDQLAAPSSRPSKRTLSVEKLWSPWRSQYVTSNQEDQECFLCAHFASDDDATNGVLWRGEKIFIVLNKYPYNPGHLMIAPTRHVGELEELSTDELHELIEQTQRSVAILKEAMNAHGFNAGMNLGSAAGAGVPGHLHQHVLPRWGGDTNFMPTIAETKVLPELLSDTYANTPVTILRAKRLHIRDKLD